MENKIESQTHPAVVLHARWGSSHWTVYSQGKWEHEERDFAVQLGRLPFIGFGDIEVTAIEEDCIRFTQWHGNDYVLTPGGTLHFSAEIEGREWSDGCSYDGDDYSLTLTWIKPDIKKS